MFVGSLFFLPRLQPAAGLMERIQAIAQNVSDIAIKVDQILRNSLMNAKSECCPQVPSSSSPIRFLCWHLLPSLSLCSGGWQEGPVRGAQGPQVPRLRWEGGGELKLPTCPIAMRPRGGVRLYPQLCRQQQNHLCEAASPCPYFLCLMSEAW